MTVAIATEQTGGRPNDLWQVIYEAYAGVKSEVMQETFSSGALERDAAVKETQE